MMNHAKINKSPRLKRVLDYLSDGNPHSTLEIVVNANVCAVNSCISELRCNGYDIKCQREGDVWRYQLEV